MGVDVYFGTGGSQDHIVGFPSSQSSQTRVISVSSVLSLMSSKEELKRIRQSFSGPKNFDEGETI